MFEKGHLTKFAVLIKDHLCLGPLERILRATTIKRQLHVDKSCVAALCCIYHTYTQSYIL